MKKIALIALSTLALSGTALADDFSGHRVGFGYQGGSLTLDSTSNKPVEDLRNDNLKLEYGYDFNRIFSLNAGGTIGQASTSIVGENIKGTQGSVYAEAEVGYAFDIGGAAIKPYVAAGASYNFDDLENEDKYNRTGTGAHAALGARLTTNVGFYVDGRIQNGKVKYRNVEEAQGALTVGYRF